jgi:hypothetical protein
MPYVLYKKSVQQFYCANFLDLLQFIIANLNIFVLSGFVRNEPGLVRGRNIISATVDMPCILARFGCSFGKKALVSYLTRNQFGSFRRLLITRRIRKFENKIWAIARVRMACARMRFVTVGILRLARLPIMLLFMLPIRLPIRLSIRLLAMLTISILRLRARILLIRAVVARLRCVFHSEISDCHFKGLVGDIHWMWLVR